MKELLEQLSEKRSQIEESKHYLDGLKSEKIELETQILEEMNKLELKSARYDSMTATISNRKTLKVTDEKEVVKYLKANKLTDYISERPNDLFEVFRKQAEKENVEVPGMEMSNTEFLSIRVKKDKE